MAPFPCVLFCTDVKKPLTVLFNPVFLQPHVTDVLHRLLHSRNHHHETDREQVLSYTLSYLHNFICQYFTFQIPSGDLSLSLYFTAVCPLVFLVFPHCIWSAVIPLLSSPSQGVHWQRSNSSEERGTTRRHLHGRWPGEGNTYLRYIAPLCFALVCRSIYTNISIYDSVGMDLYVQAGIEEICYLFLKGQPVWSLYWLMENWISGSLILREMSTQNPLAS